jgi:hypothetical protein
MFDIGHKGYTYLPGKAGDLKNPPRLLESNGKPVLVNSELPQFTKPTDALNWLQENRSECTLFISPWHDNSCYIITVPGEAGHGNYQEFTLHTSRNPMLLVGGGKTQEFKKLEEVTSTLHEERGVATKFLVPQSSAICLIIGIREKVLIKKK